MNRDKAREILTRGSPATEPLLEVRLAAPSNVEQPQLVDFCQDCILAFLPRGALIFNKREKEKKKWRERSKRFRVNFEFRFSDKRAARPIVPSTGRGTYFVSRVRPKL